MDPIGSITTAQPIYKESKGWPACGFPTPNIGLGASLSGQSSESPMKHKPSLSTPVSSKIKNKLPNMNMLSKYDMCMYRLHIIWYLCTYIYNMCKIYVYTTYVNTAYVKTICVYTVYVYKIYVYYIEYVFWILYIHVLNMIYVYVEYVCIYDIICIYYICNTILFSCTLCKLL
jgi:hypothetical protein